MKTPLAVLVVALSAVLGACAADAPPESEGVGMLDVGGERFSVQGLETHSVIGNAHDFYTVRLVYEAGVLELDFAAPNFPETGAFPSETELLRFPVDTEATQTVTAVYGRLCVPECLEADTVVDLLGSVSGTFMAKSGAAGPVFEAVELTFPAVEIMTEAYTDSSPDVRVSLPIVDFPSL